MRLSDNMGMRRSPDEVSNTGYAGRADTATLSCRVVLCVEVESAEKEHGGVLWDNLAAVGD